ncbi:NFATC2-interacting protein isoform X1 [Betta splendens]|uniref:NFATC2-interacting protein n=1 Tax=Betta splendens TaxID=158456 RepID=A0A6P7N9R6_BETSP|nr:NFATC2-interacting protein isoform X1 [Betta splendens]
MAEACEGQVVNPPPKRRRILNAKAIKPVPVYSNKVNSSLQLRPVASAISKNEETDDGADDSLWSEFPSKEKSAAVVYLSESEEDEAGYAANQRQQRQIETVSCPSPPPLSPIQKQSRKVKQKLRELDRNLRAVNSLLSPVCQNRTSSRHTQSCTSLMLEEEQDDEDVVIVTPGSDTFPYSSLVREIPLKIRCRTDIHKIPVLSSTPLSDVVTQLSVILNVPPPRLMLLREELELPTQSTVSELGLSIADIIECVVMAAEDRSEADEGSNITLRLHGKDRDSSQEFSLHKDAPLGSIFSQYLSKMPVSVQRNVRFHFDGSKVTHSQTPAQLSMEDGDIIEVWT